MSLLRRIPNLELLAFFVVLSVFFCFYAPHFNTASNVENLLSGYAFIAILAIGQSYPIMVRGIDLSIGSIVALGAMIIFDLVMIWEVPGYLAMPLALCVALAAGAVNGALIVYCRLQPFVATLASMAAYRGLVYAISGRQLFPELATKPIRDPWITGIEEYYDIGGATGLDQVVNLPWIPLSFLILIAVMVTSQVMLSHTNFGKNFKITGGNPEAARLAGINTKRTIISAYAISGFCAGLAAIILVARLTTATEALGNGMELTAIAAAVIGGISLQGGLGNSIGPVVGAFLLGIILIGLTLMGVSQFVQQILSGAILVGAVTYDLYMSKTRARRARALQSGV
ncbi:ABC transporter permease [Polycladidibacter hongkongensis]|uniref:ABC transporter permease n=1 Tax=Polycladidibacter hongkongensis TaxID=1647556 RepID=UPI000831355A|nr:ABC transporter permease [Pseudovibrio hongkongensis]